MSAVVQVMKPDVFDEMSQHYSTLFVATKPDIFDETLRHFPALFQVTTLNILGRHRDISSSVSGRKPDIFEEMSGHFQLHLWEQTEGY